MADEQIPKSQDEYVKRGKGQKDEVGGSRIFPASAPDAPADAEIRTEAGLVGHTGAKGKEKQKVGPTDGQTT